MVRIVPTAATLNAITREFLRVGHGVITSTSDAVLKLAFEISEEMVSGEVKPLAQLVGNVLRLCGEETRHVGSNLHRRAAIVRALREAGEDSVFHPSRTFPGTAEAIEQTLTLLHGWGYRADDLEIAADRADPALAAKLRSLAEVDRRFQSLLDGMGCDSHTEQLRACLACTADFDESDRRVLCILGAEFCPLQLDWIRWLAGQEVEVTVVVYRHAVGGKVFEGAERIVQALGVPAEDLGDGTLLARRVFGDPEASGLAVPTRIMSAADPLAEAEWVLREAVAHGDPAQTTVFVRSLEDYAPLFEAASLRLGIPVRLERRAPLLTNAPARLTLALLTALAGPRVAPLGELTRSSYGRLSFEAQREWNAALTEIDRSPEPWAQLRSWCDARPDVVAWLPGVLAWRESVLAEACPLADWCPRLAELMEQLPWHTSDEDDLDGYRSSRDARTKEQMLRTMYAAASVSHAAQEGPLPLSEFVATVRRQWEDADVSAPSQREGVCITGTPEALFGASQVAAVGLLEGLFPKRRRESPILHDLDREALSDCFPERPRLETSHNVALRERDLLYLVVASATGRLLLSYPETTDERDSIPAYYLTQIQALAGEENTERRDRGREQVAPPEEELAASPAPIEADADLRASLGGRWLFPPSSEALSPRFCDDPFRPPGPVEISELVDAATCGFRYAAKFEYGLEATRESEDWYRVRNLPKKARVFGMADLGEVRRALDLELDALCQDLRGRIADYEIASLRTGGERWLEKWVEQEASVRSALKITAPIAEYDVPVGHPWLSTRTLRGETLSGSLPVVVRGGAWQVMRMKSGPAADEKTITDRDLFLLSLWLHTAREVREEQLQRCILVESDSQWSIFTIQTVPDLPSKIEGVRRMAIRDLIDQRGDGGYQEFSRRMLERTVEVRKRRDFRPVPCQTCERCEFAEFCRRGLEQPGPEGAA